MKRALSRLGGGALAAAMLAGALGPAPARGQEGERADRVMPLSRAITVLGGSGAYLGIEGRDVDGDIADEAGLSGEYGVYVAGVTGEGPAAAADVREGDVIVAWNGTRLESMAQLQRLIRETPPGRSVELGLLRDGSRREANVELGDRADARDNVRVFSVPRERTSLRTAPRIRDRVNIVTPDEGVVRSIVSSSRPRLGVSLQSLGDQLADYFGVEDGALVTSVSEDSPAEAAGLRAGDVIIELGGERVGDPGEVVEALIDREAGPVDVRVVRDGAERTFTVQLEESTWERGDGGVFYFRNGDRDRGELRFFGEDGELEFEPMSFEGFQIGPIEFDGLEMEPFDWTFDFGFDGEPLEISIPRMEMPGFELPMLDIPEIRIPAFDIRAPRVTIIV